MRRREKAFYREMSECVCVCVCGLNDVRSDWLVGLALALALLGRALGATRESLPKRDRARTLLFPQAKEGGGTIQKTLPGNQDFFFFCGGRGVLRCG